MSTPDSFDPSLYTVAPRMTLESGLALARALVIACPPNAPARIQKAAKKLGNAADKAQDKLALRQKALGTISDEDRRLVDQAGDASWGSLRGRLSAYAQLPADEYPDAKRAAEINTSLFADQGLSFLTESYPIQWAIADTILQRITKESLETDINRIAGPEFLENIRKRHQKYSAMVQQWHLKSEIAQVDLSAEIRTLGQAIVHYATNVCAEVDEEKPESVNQARTALHPIDMHREANAKKSPAATSGPEPTPNPAGSAIPTP
jgi:hypothetical protein